MRRDFIVNYSEFINQRIINKNGESGEVVFFSEDHITVRYPTGEKTYNPEVAMKNGFLLFADEKYQQLYNDELENKEMLKKNREEVVRKIDADRPTKIKRVNKLNEQYEQKIRILRGLFGSDFVYPPYVEFLKKYKELITKKLDIFHCYYLFHPYEYKYR